MLAQYVLHDEKMLCYLKYTLYRLKKTKIAFKQYLSINSKLYWSTFNYLKFYAISYFIQCIWNYSSVVNNNTAYSEGTYKFFLKAFYNKTNKKEYEL